MGWISFADTLLFGFGLVFVLATSLSDVLNSRTDELEAVKQSSLGLTSELSETSERLARQRNELERLKERQAQERDASVEKQQSLEAEFHALKEKHDDLASRFERARTVYSAQKVTINALRSKVQFADEMASQLKEAQRDLGVVQANYEQLLDENRERERDEKRVRSELLGIKGPLQRVAIVFDASESMKTGDRWDAAKKVMLEWAEHLDMAECKLIVFNDFVTLLPSGDELLSLRGPDAGTERERIRTFLERIAPAGRTNTLAALEAAYAIESLDTIVLFTDGAPYASGENVRFDAVMVEQIYKLCESRTDIPINAVGLGDYFSPELSSFLLKLAEITGGTFVGR